MTRKSTAGMTWEQKVEATKEVEDRIEAIMAEESGPDYEPWDEDSIKELREWAYYEAGWAEDPWAEDEEPEEDEEPFNGDWYAYNGVSRWDFF